MSNKFFNHLSLMFLAIPALTLSSCNLFGGISSSSEGPNLPSETVESEESIESVESGDSYDPEYMTPGLIIENGVVTRYEGTDTEVVIPSIHNGYNVTSIGDSAFYGCTSLTSIIIPKSVTSIGDWAFSYCTSLTSISIPNSVTSIGDLVFSICTSLTSINVDSKNIYYTSIDGILYSNDATTLICCPGGKVGEVIIPNSVTSIGEGAFLLCTSLTSINVDSNNAYYTSIDGILYSNDVTTLICCPGGKVGEVIIPNSVTSISNYAFYYCTSLTSIIIPNSVTSIGDSAFTSCTSLTSINIPNSVTSIGVCAFYYCYSLTSIYIPNSVTSIGDNAFYYCTSLTSITIPDSVTSIGVGAFSHCTSLTSIIIPNSVTSIGDSAFAGCTSLTIYCEVESQPSGWDPNWNPDDRPVEWGVNPIKCDTINVDAGGNALALINDSSIKLHTPDGWLFGGWRLSLACDSQGRITYCVYAPNAGYGGPTDNSYLCHDFYKDPNNENPSIELLDGFGPWVPGETAHTQFNINIPKGGFGLMAHGSKAKEILIAITDGYITEEIFDSENFDAINNNSNPCNAILTVVGDKIIVTN